MRCPCRSADASCTGDIVVFSLWYWEFDRGGPGKRALGEREYADVMFPQLSSPELADKDWVPLGTWSYL
jgi:hypothetical protein